MEVRNTGPFNSNLEVSPVKGEEVLIDPFSDRSKGEEGAEKKEAQIKKKASNKPSSVTLATHESDVKDLVEKFSDRMAKSSFSYEQKELQKNIKRNLDTTLEELFSEKVSQKTQDEVTISASVLSNKEEIIKKQKNKTVQTEKEVVDEKALTGKVENAQAQVIASQLKKKKLQKEQNQQRSSISKKESNIQETLKRYVSAFSESLIKNNPQKKQEAKQLRQKLLDEGYSNSKLKTLEGRVQKFIHGDLRKRFKKSFLKFVLSYAPKKLTMDLMRDEKAYSDLEKFGLQTGLFDKTEVDEMKNQTREDLRGFVSDELDKSLIKSKVRGDSVKELMSSFARFNALASVSKFNQNKYFSEFQKKLDNMGLIAFEDPNKKGIIDTETSSDSDKEKGHESLEPLSSEELEDIEDQLRILFMQKAMGGGFAIETRIKIRKLKNTLRKSGKFDEELIKKLTEEGEAIAKLKFMAILKQTFEERAALPILKGPEYSLIKRKMKVALKGLKALGSPILRSEAKDIRDTINKAMFSVIKEDYLKAEAQLENDPNCLSLKQTRNRLLETLERLKKESKIKESLKPKMFADIREVSDTSIMEAA